MTDEPMTAELAREEVAARADGIAATRIESGAAEAPQQCLSACRRMAA